MALSRMGKFKVFLGFLAVIAVVAAWQGIRYWIHYGYASGTKTGIVRKVAYKGPPYCKYIMAEMVMQQGANAVANAQTWEFSVDTRDESAPIVKQLKEAEKTGKLTTITYRQDLDMWWRCAPTEYFATVIDK